MNRYGFYEEFIKGNRIRLAELFNEIHECYKYRNDLYKSIKEYEFVLRKVGMDFDALTSMLTTPSHKMILNKHTRKVLSPEIVKSVAMFVYTACTKIPKLKHELQIVRLLCNMPDRLYFIMQYDFNREISNSILRGGVYSFGQGMSKMGISYVLRRPNAKPVVDWGESNKLKKKLIEEGHTVRTKENPNGVKWLLYRTDDGYCFWKWLKREAFIPNKKMYRFRAIATNNECTDYHGALSQEQILEKSIGTFDKMMALLKLNPKMIERYDF